MTKYRKVKIGKSWVVETEDGLDWVKVKAFCTEESADAFLYLVRAGVSFHDSSVLVYGHPQLVVRLEPPIEPTAEQRRMMGT